MIQHVQVFVKPNKNKTVSQRLHFSLTAIFIEPFHNYQLFLHIFFFQLCPATQLPRVLEMKIATLGL